MTATQPTLVSIATRGPVARLLRALGIISREELQPVRAIALLLLVTWVPLAVLTILRGTFVGDAVEITFIGSAAAQAKLLVALPLLVLAEAGVAKGARFLIDTVRARSLLTDDAWDTLEAEVQRLRHWRDSAVVELAIAALVILAVTYVARSSIMLVELQRSSWLVDAAGRPSLAGWWYLRVSLFVLALASLRWTWWILLWLRFLVVFLRPRLRVVPGHPDGVGGLSFLSKVQKSFALVFMSLAATVSGRLANELLYEGASLEATKIPVAVVLVLAALVMFGPMLLFAPQMAAARGREISAYDRLGQRLVDEFDAQWVPREADRNDLLGAPHASTLADFTSVYGALSKMRPIPVYLPYFVGAMVLVVLPFLPLLLTELSLAEMAQRMLKMLL
jgi:hypothetical protein